MLKSENGTLWQKMILATVNSVWNAFSQTGLAVIKDEDPTPEDRGSTEDAENCNLCVE